MDGDIWATASFMIERTDNHNDTLISIATANMANSPHLMSFDILTSLEESPELHPAGYDASDIIN